MNGFTCQVKLKFYTFSETSTKFYTFSWKDIKCIRVQYKVE